MLMKCSHFSRELPPPSSNKIPCIDSHHALSRFIVEKGGLLTASDKHGWSVLQYAVRYASLETVETLIDLGADIFHR